jgi:DNA-binding transcriptional ArsR family regulator
MTSRRQDRQFMQQGATRAAAMLRTLGNEQRLLLLCLLIEHDELTVGQLQEQVELSQSALSQHLARMREDGLVTSRREGQSMYYRIDDPRVETLVAALKSVFCP